MDKGGYVWSTVKESEDDLVVGRGGGGGLGLRESDVVEELDAEADLREE